MLRLKYFRSDSMGFYGMQSLSPFLASSSLVVKQIPYSDRWSEDVDKYIDKKHFY